MRAELYWIEVPWPGRLAIMPRPRGGDWLEDEVRDWKKLGVDVVVSTLRHDEIAELDLALEPELCQANGIEFIALPIPDRGVPPSAKAVAELVHSLDGRLEEGKNVAIHCRQGVGRSALMAASVQASAGVDSETAFARVQAARGCPVPDTVEQREWVRRFMGDYRAVGSGH